MKSGLAAVVLFFTVFAISRVDGREIGFVEDFALAKDRTEALKNLIPGTADYYYYHCLHAQNTGDFRQVGKMLDQWITREGYTARVEEILSRQAILEYELNPKKSLEHIKKKLGLRFDHQREIAAKDKDLPSHLDQALISIPKLMGRSLSRHKNLDGVTDRGLDIVDTKGLNPERRRDFLRRLQRPDIPGLAKLVVEDLKYKHSGGFGSHPIHGRLFKSQMDECLRLMPELLENSQFINACIAKLAPGNDVDIRYNPDEKRAYLERLAGFARKLPPAHNSFRAFALYHLLDANRSDGNYDQKLFMEYLQIPRNAGYMNHKYATSRHRFEANLNADFRGLTGLPPVESDDELVRDCLSRFFLKAKNYKPCQKYIEDGYLKNIFAETKIVNGEGDMEQWYSMMSPSAYKALKDRVDLDFAPSNKRFFATDETVSLELYVKNVKTMIIKVFELNAFNYYRDTFKEIDTAVELDGLAATSEKAVTYDDPPTIRTRRVFEFPNLNRPGVYAVEFIGNGKSSRALIRKGALRFVERIGPAGHEFTVYDETNTKRPKARIWLSGREFTPEDDGTIVISFTNNPGTQTVILKDGDYCSLASFYHLEEKYELRAGFYTNRESLIRDVNAKVIVRPVLTVNGHATSLSLLEDVRLTIESRDTKDVSSTKDISDFKIADSEESEYEFRVPPNLESIRFVLKGKIRNVSKNKDENLESSGLFRMSGQRTCDGMGKARCRECGYVHQGRSFPEKCPICGVYDFKWIEGGSDCSIEDVFLSRTGGEYVLEILGKNGEPKSDRSVSVELRHEYFRDPVNVSLKTDRDGRIRLGRLDGIVNVYAKGPGNISVSRSAVKDMRDRRHNLNGPAGKTVRVPWVGRTGGEPRLHFALFEKRGETYFEDKTSSVRITGGFLEIDGLAAGDYELFLKDTDERIQIRLTGGGTDDGFAFSGKRVLEMKNENPLHITDVSADKDSVRLKIGNASEYARIHVIATRFMPQYNPFENLGLPAAPGLFEIGLVRPETMYVSGRRIGDEHRYILERKYAKKYPGNMLDRPEFLLNPWSIRKTETADARAMAGEEYKEMKPPAPEQASRTSSMDGDPDGFARAEYGPHFLAEPPVILANLKPDASGSVVIDRKLLGFRTQLHILAVDPFNTIYREISLADVSMDTRDLRLARSLDPEKRFTEQKRISSLGLDETLTIADTSTSEFEIYDTVARVYQLMSTMNSDPSFEEFGFITEWPELAFEEKQKKYSKYACHELNFFIYRKDRKFFDQVVEPYIKNKKDKTFLDRWLIGDDLAEYLKPWPFSQLNIVEKILLSKRGPDGKKRIIRHVKELYEMIPPDAEEHDRLFDQALKGRSLESEDLRYGFEDLSGWGASRVYAPVGASGSIEGPVARGLPIADSLFDAELAEPEPAEEKDALREMKRDEVRPFKSLRKKRKKPKPFFRKPDKTEEWVENNYYKLPMENQNADLVRVNAFWNDFAENSVGEPFLSTNFIYATNSFTEMMLALSVLDLPFKSGKYERTVEKRTMVFKFASPAVVFHKQIKPVESGESDIKLSVSQNYFKTDDRFEYEGNEHIEKYVKDEFLIHAPYGCRAVVGNPASSTRKASLLLQIPKGAIPLNNGFYTESVPVTLGPYQTRTFEYQFYFPKSGKFAHFPAQAADGEKFIAGAAASELSVVEKPSRTDTLSWDYVSQNGGDKEVLDFLANRNLNRIDLGKIAFRMRIRPFFLETVALLKKRHAYNHTLWSYGIFHNKKEAISEYLQHSDYADRCGTYIDAPLLTVDPVERKIYQHMEYKPLINARAHRLGAKRKILNDRFYKQYERFMKKLSYTPAVNDADSAAAVYYLLLQDRVEEALEHFAGIDPKNVESKIQYDYLTVYLDFYTGNLKRARSVASGYLDYPVPRWRDLFKHAVAQLDETEGKQPAVADKQSRDQVQAKLASEEPFLDFKIEAKTVAISYRNLDSCTVNHYPMNIELLFSKNPFMRRETGNFAYIRPVASVKIELPAGGSAHEIELPPRFHNSNLMVEITGGGLSKTSIYSANSLDAQIIETYGRLRIAHETTKKPLAGTYVKVYARMRNGEVRFYKDGYTDFRGMFDYASLSTDDLDSVEKFAILSLHEEYGAIVKQAVPPKR